MTREERIAEMAELLSNVKASVCEYNEAFQGGEIEKALKLKASIADAVNEYTSKAREACFADLKESGNPMMGAIEQLTYSTITTKERKDKEDKAAIPVLEVIEKERPIDLMKLDKYCGGIGADGNWIHLAQKFNFLLTAQKAKDLGIDPKAVNDSYTMSSIARDLDMGKTPTSKTGLLKSLQAVVSAMVGPEYKATSHDVAYMMSVYSKKGKQALAVSCANHKNFVGYMAAICHRIVKNETYIIEFKADKQN